MFKGVYTALITPFNIDGSVNLIKLKELVEFNISKGINGLVACGTTGESTTLSKEEKIKIIDEIIKTNRNRVKLLVGISNNSTMNSVDFTRELEEKDIDGLMVLTPYYNKTNSEGNFKHFEEICNSTIKPVIIYNVPSRTGVDLTIEEIVKISSIKNVVGIKEASSCFDKIKELKRETNLTVFLGNDDMVEDGLELEVDGVISVFSNIFPNVFVEAFEGKTNKIEKYKKFINALSIEPNPIPIKQALNFIGLEVGNYRLPLCKMGSENKNKLLKELWEVI